MARWWPRPSPALDAGRARAATGAWLPGISVASVVEELKLRRCNCSGVYGCALAESRDRVTQGRDRPATHTYATQKVE